MFYILILLLILLGVFYLIYQQSNKSIQNIPTLSILQKNVCTNSIESYCDIWGYSYNNDADCILIINDEITSINNNLSMTLVLTLMSNKDYIFFYGSDSYLVKTSSKLSKDTIYHEVSNLPIPNLELLQLLYQGYPFVTDNGLILHRAYLDRVFNNTSPSFDIPSIIPDTLPKRYSKPSTKIPHVLYQTHYSRLVPSKYATNVNSWLDHNHDYDYCFFDNGNCRAFIEEHFDEKVLNAYDKLIPGAYKSDLWRYCVIYQNGGVYANLNLEPTIALSSLIKPDSELVYIDGFNGFFAAAARNPIIKLLIDEVVSRVENEEYGTCDSYPTGNSLFVRFKYPNSQIINKNNIRITEELDSNFTGLPHYSILWKDHMIYR